MHIITRSPFNSAGTSAQVGLGERSVRQVSVRHAGAAGDRLGYKVSAQHYTGMDWEYEDPAEVRARAANPDIPPRNFDIERQSTEARLDYRATDELTAILAAGYNKGNQIELTGLGAGQAQDWAYNYVQLRLLYKNWFAQVFQNGSDAGETFTLRDGKPIVDKSKLTAFQLQHSVVLGVRQRFTYGADVLLTRPDTEGTITGGNEDYDQTNEFGAYVQSETALSEMLDVVVALRYDDHNRIPEGEISPRVGLVFKPQETQILRLTYNHAFATPSSNNLYLDIRSSPRMPSALAQPLRRRWGLCRLLTCGRREPIARIWAAAGPLLARAMAGRSSARPLRRWRGWIRPTSSIWGIRSLPM